MYVDGFSPIYAVDLKIKKSIFFQIFMNGGKMFQMHVDEIYDAKCRLYVMYIL